MASSNRHWPSMFKSKPCSNTHHHQWQHDINPSLIPSCQRSPFNSGGHEERSPEPKPRWNPKPEQIRILEAIFNSGMVNPPRDEIRKIRAQLQEYGQVGDANVFYWFQNRKSRSKHKQKHLQSSKTVQSHHHHHNIPPITTTTSVSATTTAATTSVAASSSTSSSSSEKSSPKKGTDYHHSINSLQMGGVGGGGSSSLSSINVLDVSNSSTTSVNNQNLSFGTSHADLPLFFPFQNNLNFNVFPQNQTLFDPSNVVQVPDHQVLGPCSHGLLLTELLNQEGSKRDHNLQQFSFSTATSATAAAVNAQANIASSATASARFDINSIQGVVAGMSSPAAAGRLTVFINDVAFEVAVGPFNVREAFGDEALLIHSSGQPVLTNEWGITLQSLQPGVREHIMIRRRWNLDG